MATCTEKQLAEWKTRVAFIALLQADIKHRLETLQAIESTEDVTAWCTDYSLELTGTVGTMEILKQAESGQIIRPGFTDSAAWVDTRDGNIQNAWGNTPAAAAFNFAALPGSQKHFPIYRLGEITVLSGDICSVLLDGTKSRIRQFSVDQVITLTDVPIEYMDCNGEAFTEGDRVVVYFSDHKWTSPKVIGFETYPQPCAPEACFIVGEIVQVDSTYDDREQLLWIKDNKNDITPIVTRPSDWIEWAVGDSIMAISPDNCLCTEQCGEDREYWAQTNQLLDLTNTFRAGEGLNPLILNRRLTESAKWMAEDQADNCLFGHDGSDGSTILSRFIRDGYILAGGAWTIGENGGFGYDIESVFASWLLSPAHLPQLVNAEFNEMGFGAKRVSATCNTIYDSFHDVTYTKGIDYDEDFIMFYHTFGRKYDPEPWLIVPVQTLPGDLE